MKIKISRIAILVMSLSTLCACTSHDDTTLSQEKYMDLYQKTCIDLQSAFASTRGNFSAVPTGAVTEAEVKSINNLQVLTTYDKERLVTIQASEIYQRMKAEEDQYVTEAKKRFLQEHSIPQYGMLRTL